jgi:hypothetical protein
LKPSSAIVCSSSSFRLMRTPRPGSASRSSATPDVSASSSHRLRRTPGSARFLFLKV